MRRLTFTHTWRLIFGLLFAAAVSISVQAQVSPITARCGDNDPPCMYPHKKVKDTSGATHEPPIGGGGGGGDKFHLDLPSGISLIRSGEDDDGYDAYNVITVDENGKPQTNEECERIYKAKVKNKMGKAESNDNDCHKRYKKIFSVLIVTEEVSETPLLDPEHSKPSPQPGDVSLWEYRLAKDQKTRLKLWLGKTQCNAPCRDIDSDPDIVITGTDEGLIQSKRKLGSRKDSGKHERRNSFFHPSDKARVVKWQIVELKDNKEIVLFQDEGDDSYYFYISFDH